MADLSITGDDIKQGDIVLFRPSQGQDSFSISRVVALPGDIFELKNDFLMINGRASQIQELTTKYIDYEPHLVFREILSGGRAIQICKIDTRAGIKNIPPMTVPGDSIILISDNLDNALDSRYLGALPKKSIAGKVLFTFLGKKPSRIGIDLTGQ